MIDHASTVAKAKGKFPPGGNFHLSGNFDRAAAAESIKALHEQAKFSAKLAMVYAARAGAELLRAKEMLPHGQFGEFRSECALSHTTSTAYMGLAEQLHEKLKGRADLLVLPAPGEPFSQDARKLIGQIEKITDGKTLTQLYFDWDIKRDPKQLGGDNALKTWLKQHHPQWAHVNSMRELPKELREEWRHFVTDREKSGFDPKDLARDAWHKRGDEAIVTVESYILGHKHALLRERAWMKATRQILHACVVKLDDVLKKGQT